MPIVIYDINIIIYVHAFNLKVYQSYTDKEAIDASWFAGPNTNYIFM